MKLASDAWEVREKSGDYGVDLEFEVFNADDSATGTVAYVQSKGTASKDNEPSVSIRVETLQYLNSFDVPSLIFCHSTSTGKSFWMWAQEAIWRVKPGAASVKLAFRTHHLWHGGTSDEIERSLKSYRLLRARDNYAHFPISTDEENSEIDALMLDGIRAEIASLLPFAKEDGIGGRIPLIISIRGNSVQVRIERFLWRSIRAKSGSNTDLLSATIYLLIMFWREFGFTNQAEIGATKCLTNQLPAPDREAASEAAIVLINRPQAAVNLALMNELHTACDLPMNRFIAALYSSLESIDEKTMPLEKFTYAAINNSEDKSPNYAFLYNLAKYYRINGKFLKGVAAYNALRKMDPTYLDRTYYWYELGNILYRSKKYEMSAVCYKKLVSLEDIPITNLVLGDAYFYGNKLAKAKSAYFSAKDDLTAIGAEAELKYQIIRWIEDIDEANRLCPSARNELFDFRKKALDCSDRANAFWSHIALTFLDSEDVDCWADALFLSLILEDISLFQDVLRCALCSHGLRPYLKLKADRSELFEHLGELVEEIDQLVREIHGETLAEEAYEPGVSVGEPERLFKQGVMRVTNMFQR